MKAYPAVADHGVIGDLQTAALLASDGSLDGFCSPTYPGWCHPPLAWVVIRGRTRRLPRASAPAGFRCSRPAAGIHPDRDGRRPGTRTNKGEVPRGDRDCPGARDAAAGNQG
jgi:hypothetical protein